MVLNHDLAQSRLYLACNLNCAFALTLIGMFDDVGTRFIDSYLAVENTRLTQTRRQGGFSYESGDRLKIAVLAAHSQMPNICHPGAA
jgi:hypothetical protein